MPDNESFTYNASNYIVYNNGFLISEASSINFTYKISKPPLSNSQISERVTLSQGRSLSEIAKAINNIEEWGCVLTLSDIQPQNWKLNLEVIDSWLPKIIGAAFYYSLKTNGLSWAELINILNKNNPMAYNLSQDHDFYRAKIITFLREVAMGMNAENVWMGGYDSALGITIKKAIRKKSYIYLTCAFFKNTLSATQGLAAIQMAIFMRRMMIYL